MAKKGEEEKKAKKEAEHKSLWQNYNERQYSARVKWKMAALIRQANNWNQMARWKGWWKQRRKIMEKEGWKNIHYSHPIKNRTCMVTNSLWQHLMWLRLETRNPCTQYKLHNDANSHCTLNRHSWRTHIIFYFKKNQIVLTSEAPQGYSHHPHIETEWNKKQNGTLREEKQTE